MSVSRFAPMEIAGLSLEYSLLPSDAVYTPERGLERMTNIISPARHGSGCASKPNNGARRDVYSVSTLRARRGTRTGASDAAEYLFGVLPSLTCIATSARTTFICTLLCHSQPILKAITSSSAPASTRAPD
ncbi:hypothetical protein U1Q18_044842 [Sarracenia purpurea var. burkii]